MASTLQQLLNYQSNINLPTIPTASNMLKTQPTSEKMNEVDNAKADEPTATKKANTTKSSNRSRIMERLFKPTTNTDDDMQQAVNSGRGNALVNTAAQYIGTPYVWGGTSPSGFDCSGLMQYSYAQNGISIPRTSQEQFKSGSAVSLSQMQPGDLVFFAGSNGSASAPGHVAMYAGNGNIIEAPQTGMNVREIPLSQKSTPVGARRYS